MGKREIVEDFERELKRRIRSCLPGEEPQETGWISSEAEQKVAADVERKLKRGVIHAEDTQQTVGSPWISKETEQKIAVDFERELRVRADVATEKSPKPLLPRIQEAVEQIKDYVVFQLRKDFGDK